MPSSFSLGEHFESFVQAQLATGRYNNASEILRDALRLMEERDQLLQLQQSAIDAKIQAGMKSLKAGKSVDGEAFFAKLDAKLAATQPKRKA